MIEINKFYVKQKKIKRLPGEPFFYSFDLQHLSIAIILMDSLIGNTRLS
jgi:hypothetical protein